MLAGQHVGRCFISEDPSGFIDGTNLYAYVGGNPIRFVDPSGLFTFSVEAYAGVGGGLSVSYKNGTLEVLGRLGVGLGGGLSYDPNGAPSPHSKSTGSGYIARTRFNAQAGIGAGPLTAGVNATATTGNAVTTPVGGDFFGSGNGSGALTPSGAFEPASGFGLRFGGSVTTELGSYTNWGK